MTTQIHVSRFPSPVGPLRLATVDDQLVHLDFDDNEERMHSLQNRRFRQPEWREQPNSAPGTIIEWLNAYFSGVILLFGAVISSRLNKLRKLRGQASTANGTPSHLDVDMLVLTRTSDDD